MYPPVPTGLPCVVPTGGATICGEYLPEDTTLGVHHLATYRNEALFRKAHEFHPERWLGDPDFRDDQLDALEPFSFGPRNCLGKVSVTCTVVRRLEAAEDDSVLVSQHTFGSVKTQPVGIF